MTNAKTQNASTELTLAGGGHEETDSEGALYGRLLSYNDANEGQRAQIDTLIAGMNIHDENSILMVGDDIMQTIRALSQEIAQSIILNDEEKTLGPSVRNISGMIENCTPEKLAEVPSRMGRVVNLITSRVRGENVEETESRRALAKMRENLGKAEADIGLMIQALDNQILSIDKNHRLIVRMCNALRAASIDLQVTTAAVSEYQRQVDENILPQARQRFEDTRLAIDAQSLENLMLNSELLRRQHSNLVGSCNLALKLAFALNRTRITNRRSHLETRGLATHSVATWFQQLAAYGLMSQEMIHRVVIAEGHRMTDNAVEASGEVFARMIQATAATSGRGTFDLAKVVAANARFLRELKKATATEIEMDKAERDSARVASEAVVLFDTTARGLELARLRGDRQELERTETRVTRLDNMAKLITPKRPTNEMLGKPPQTTAALLPQSS